MASPPKLNPLAEQLNARLEEAAPEVLAMLSALGRRLYFPKGIITQTAEAKQKAHRFNATIGIATEDGGPMILPPIAGPIGDVPAADDRLLRLAAATEARSEHPLAKAILRAAEARGIEVPAPEDFHAAAGPGVARRAGGGPRDHRVLSHSLHPHHVGGHDGR